MRFLNARGAIAAAFMIAASVQPSAAETIKIGVFGPFSGDAAAMGGSEKDAVSLVFQEKNAAGGIHGQQIEPVYADDSGKPEEAVNTVKRLISRDDVLLNIGSISSPASLAASQVSRQSETAQIVVGGTAQRITTSGHIGHLAVSPDGRFAAYTVTDDDAGESVWLQQIATGSRIVVMPAAPKTFYAGLTFSADGNQVHG